MDPVLRENVWPRVSKDAIIQEGAPWRTWPPPLFTSPVTGCSTISSPPWCHTRVWMALAGLTAQTPLQALEEADRPCPKLSSFPSPSGLVLFTPGLPVQGKREALSVLGKEQLPSLQRLLG